MGTTSGGTFVGNILTDTQVNPEGGGRFSAHIPDAWRVVNAFGGVIFALALRAMHHALGRDRFRPVAASAVFCRGVPCGPVTIDVEILRTGSTLAQATADVRSAVGDDVGLRAVGVFGPDSVEDVRARGWVFPSSVPPAEHCPPVDARTWGNVPLFQQTDWREVAPQGSDLPAGVCARSLEWERFVRPPFLADGTLDMIAMTGVFADSLAHVISKAIALRTQLVNPVTLDLSVQFFAPPKGAWLLRDSQLFYCSDRYAYGTATLWDHHGTLLGVTHQRAFCQSVSSQERSKLGW